MFPAPFGALLDANVLYPMSLRDTLLRAAAAGIYQVLWSAEIVDEARHDLVADKRMSGAQAQRLFDMQMFSAALGVERVVRQQTYAPRKAGCLSTCLLVYLGTDSMLWVPCPFVKVTVDI